MYIHTYGRGRGKVVSPDRRGRQDTKEHKKAAVTGGKQGRGLGPQPPGVFCLFPAEAIASAGTQ